MNSISVKYAQHMAHLLREISTHMEESGFNAQQASSQLENESAVEVAKIMAALKDLNECAEAVKKESGKVYDHVRTLVLPDKMDDEGLDNMRVAGLGRVSVTADVRATIADKQAGYKWLEEHGYGDMITETVNASALKALMRRMIKEGREIPDEIFKVTPFNRASITKT